jgi:hypothetical protein
MVRDPIRPCDRAELITSASALPSEQAHCKAGGELRPAPWRNAWGADQPTFQTEGGSVASMGSLKGLTDVSIRSRPRSSTLVLPPPQKKKRTPVILEELTS